MAQSVMDPVRSKTCVRAQAAPVVALAPPQRRRPTWMIWGAALVIASAVLGAWAFSSSTARISIVVAARDLEPGDVVAGTDWSHSTSRRDVLVIVISSANSGAEDLNDHLTAARLLTTAENGAD